MASRADTLRDLIAYYRGRLHEGVIGSLAIVYLREIASAEAELEEIERRERMLDSHSQEEKC
jgi:hypothetical protein